MAIRNLISKLVESDQRQRDLQSAKTPSAQRRRRKRHRTTLETSGHNSAGTEDESNWLVSYADMMTLLCGFFVMMFALSTVDVQKFEKVKEEVSKTFKGTYHPPSTVELAKHTENVLAELGVQGQVEVRSTPTNVSIIFQSTLFFDTLSADIKGEGKEVLGKVIAGLLKQQSAQNKNYHITVEGHTDSRPIAPGALTHFATNWELSGARASMVVRTFIDAGFQPKQLAAVGLADTQPELPARTPAGEWDEAALSKNRRVVLKITEETATAESTTAESVNPLTSPTER